MSLLETIIGYFDRTESKEEMVAPEGICPNCWGSQEYDHKIRKLVEDKQVDVNNNEAKHAFIQNFVITNLNGIQLKNNECSKCRI